MKLSSFQKGLLIVLLVGLSFGFLILFNHIFRGDAFTREEAQHGLYGVWIYKDLKNLDLGSFWYDTQRQMFWPFFHSWVLSLFFLLLGVSSAAARFLSLFLFLATLILIYLVATKFSESDGWKIGLLAVFLAISSPLVIKFSSLNTIESLSVFLFISTFYLYLYAEERKLTIDYVLVAFLLGLSLYTHYLYAYLIIPSFIVMSLGRIGPVLIETWQLRRKGESAALPFFWWAYRKMVVIFVLAIMVSLWFFTASFSRKVLLFMQAVFRYAGGDVIYGFWQNLFYYPMAIVKDYSFSPWLGVLILISLFLPFISFKYRHLGKIYALTWTILVLVTLTVSAKSSQFIFVLYPFLFLVFSAILFYFLGKNQKFSSILMLVVILPSFFSLPKLVSLYYPPRLYQNSQQVLDYFKSEILPRYSVAAVFNFQRLNPENIGFSFWNWNAPVLAEPSLGFEYAFSAARYFLSVELEPNSPYQAEMVDDSYFRWNVFLQEKLKNGEISEYSQRRFEQLGLTAKIYAKPSPQPQIR